MDPPTNGCQYWSTKMHCKSNQIQSIRIESNRIGAARIIIFVFDEWTSRMNEESHTIFTCYMHAMIIFCNERVSGSCVFHVLQLIKRLPFYFSFVCFLHCLCFLCVSKHFLCLIFSAVFIVLERLAKRIAPFMFVFCLLWFSTADNWQLFSNHEMIK